jgi:hypothetical protein
LPYYFLIWVIMRIVAGAWRRLRLDYGDPGSRQDYNII